MPHTNKELVDIRYPDASQEEKAAILKSMEAEPVIEVPGAKPKKTKKVK